LGDKDKPAATIADSFRLLWQNDGARRKDLTTRLTRELLEYWGIRQGEPWADAWPKAVWHIRWLSERLPDQESQRLAVVAFNASDDPDIQSAKGQGQRLKRAAEKQVLPSYDTTRKKLEAIDAEFEGFLRVHYKANHNPPRPTKPQLDAIYREFSETAPPRGSSDQGHPPSTTKKRRLWWPLVAAGMIVVVVVSAVVLYQTRKPHGKAPTNVAAKQSRRPSNTAQPTPTSSNEGVSSAGTIDRSLGVSQQRLTDISGGPDFVFPNGSAAAAGYTRVSAMPDDPWAYESAALDAGAYLLGGQVVRFGLTNLTDQTIEVYDIKIISLHQQKILTGAGIFLGAQGGGLSNVGFVLDSPAGSPREYDPETFQISRNYFEYHTIEVPPGNATDPTVLNVGTVALYAAYSFDIEIDYEIGIKQYRQLLTRNASGKPFQVTADLCPEPGEAQLGSKDQIDKYRNLRYASVTATDTSVVPFAVKPMDPNEWAARHCTSH
jgi:hypothetical protein